MVNHLFFYLLKVKDGQSFIFQHRKHWAKRPPPEGGSITGDEKFVLIFRLFFFDLNIVKVSWSPVSNTFFLTIEVRWGHSKAPRSHPTQCWS